MAKTVPAIDKLKARARTICGDVKARKVGTVMELHTCNEPPGHAGRHTDGNVRWNHGKA